jgi:hypothetical protein
MLATIKVISRMMYGSDIGMVGKLADVTCTGDERDKDEVHVGTIATVDRREVDGRILAFKRLRDGCIATVKNDAAALQTMASIGQHCGLTATTAFAGMAKDLIGELDLERECRNTHMLLDVLGHERYSAFRVRAPTPVDELSSQKQFVYGYIHGAVLNPDHDIGVIERFVKTYFTLLHLDGIVLLDPRRQNVIVEDDTGEIVIIDAGATRRMTHAEYAHNTRLHMCGLDKKQLRSRLGGADVSPELVDTLMGFCTPFWDREAEFPDVSIIRDFIKTPSLLSEKLDPSVAAITRSMLTLCHTIAQLGCRKIDVQDLMYEIRDTLASRGVDDP